MCVCVCVCLCVCVCQKEREHEREKTSPEHAQTHFSSKKKDERGGVKFEGASIKNR